MATIYLSIAGLRWRLDSPHPLTIPDRMRPFVTHEGIADVTILLSPCDSLPPVPADGFWHGLACNAANQSWHAQAPHGAPYAHIRREGKRLITIDYLPTAQDAFNGLGGVCNHIGPESVLLAHGVAVLHASLVRYRDKAVLFCGPSGCGKSTQADLWSAYRDADLLNGDRAALRCVDGVWTAYGLPFAGTSGIYRNESAPVAAIALPHKAAVNAVTIPDDTVKMRELFPQISHRRTDTTQTVHAMNLLTAILRQIPIYTLHCLPDEGAVTALYDTLTQGGLL